MAFDGSLDDLSACNASGCAGEWEKSRRAHQPTPQQAAGPALHAMLPSSVACALETCMILGIVFVRVCRVAAPEEVQRFKREINDLESELAINTKRTRPKLYLIFSVAALTSTNRIPDCLNWQKQSRLHAMSASQNQDITISTEVHAPKSMTTSISAVDARAIACLYVHAYLQLHRTAAVS